MRTSLGVGSVSAITIYEWWGDKKRFPKLGRLRNCPTGKIVLYDTTNFMYISAPGQIYHIPRFLTKHLRTFRATLHKISQLKPKISHETSGRTTLPLSVTRWAELFQIETCHKQTDIHLNTPHFIPPIGFGSEHETYPKSRSGGKRHKINSPSQHKIAATP